MENLLHPEFFTELVGSSQATGALKNSARLKSYLQSTYEIKESCSNKTTFFTRSTPCPSIIFLNHAALPFLK